jgi:integrase
MRRKTDYLFLRPGSQNWHIKLQSPTGRVEKSLRTPDRRQAEVLALPLIAEHRAALLAARPRLEPSWHHEYEPGREHIGPDGGRIIATERELIYLDANGVITSRAPNGEPTLRVMGRNAERLVRSLVKTFAKAYVEAEGRGEQPTARSLVEGFKTRPVVAVKNSDDAIFETYIKHADVTGYYEREARSMWALYRTLTDSKPLTDATRDDGRKLVAHLDEQGLKSASVRKKIMWLNAAVNLAIDEGRLKFNPFSKIVPDRKDEVKRLPLDEADIKACKRNLGQLDKSEQLLFRLLAATGMRLSEAFEVDSELKERGVRYVVVGHKTEQSKRRVPFPADLLPYLPATIKGPLFQGNARTASKRLNRFLNDGGIVDPRKVIHSLRHRAQDRLRAAGCPPDIRQELLGHEKKTVAAGYGIGHPIPLLKRWIDKIEF